VARHADIKARNDILALYQMNFWNLVDIMRPQEGVEAKRKADHEIST
jgi:hypothetical protein